MAQLHPGRLHAFDALRGIMMMLGIVLHAAIPYSTMPVETFGWELRDQQRHLAFDVLIVFIHSFRIPLFFLLSGFFMHLVLARKGPAHFIRGRLRRILVPFVLAFLVLTPVVDASVAFAMALPQGGSNFAFAVGREYLFSGGRYGELRLMHLWFLYYLILVYPVVLLGVYLAPRLFNVDPERSFVRGMLLPVLGLSAALLYLMKSGSIDTPLHVFPLELGVLVFYLIWFVIGWKLSKYPGYLQTIKSTSNVLLSGAVVALAGHLIVLETFYSTPVAVALPAGLMNSVLAAVVITCFCFGILGAFAKLFPTANRIISFLGESSYWSYLVHLPIVILVVGVFQLTSISAFLKYPLVVVITSVVTLGSYVVVAAALRVFNDSGLSVFRLPARYPKPAAESTQPDSVGG